MYARVFPARAHESVVFPKAPNKCDNQLHGHVAPFFFQAPWPGAGDGRDGLGFALPILLSTSAA